MVTNLNVAKCQGAQAAYLECTQYALRNLNLPNVAMYLDAGHAGWLGWPANITPAAELFAKLYKDAGSPRAVRGFATNVANYNAWSLTSAPAYTTPNANYDEQKYINAFHPLLQSRGFDARFIVDQGMCSLDLLALVPFFPSTSFTPLTRIQAAVVNNRLVQLPRNWLWQETQHRNRKLAR
jgi:cellulose 1,4-beta-cellobiosidase